MPEVSLDIYCRAHDFASAKFSGIGTQLRGMIGSLIPAAGVLLATRAALQGIGAAVELSAARAAEAQALTRRDAVGVLEAQLKARAATEDFAAAIPLVGRSIKKMMDAFGDKEGIQQAIKHIKELDAEIKKSHDENRRRMFKLAIDRAKLGGDEIKAARLTAEEAATTEAARIDALQETYEKAVAAHQAAQAKVQEITRYLAPGEEIVSRELKRELDALLLVEETLRGKRQEAREVLRTARELAVEQGILDVDKAAKAEIDAAKETKERADKAYDELVAREMEKARLLAQLRDAQITADERAQADARLREKYWGAGGVAGKALELGIPPAEVMAAYKAEKAVMEETWRKSDERDAEDKAKKEADLAKRSAETLLNIRIDLLRRMGLTQEAERMQAEANLEQMVADAKAAGDMMLAAAIEQNAEAILAKTGKPGGAPPTREVAAIESRFAGYIGGLEVTPETRELQDVKRILADLLEQLKIGNRKEPVKVQTYDAGRN